jgi:tRNA 2-thiouridine synthesizing protein E
MQQTYAGTVVELNKEGFMTDANQWNPGIAQAIADSVGVSLSPRHWEVINYARTDFAEKGGSPGLRRIAKFAKVPIKELYKLFPKGPGKKIARIAGLPKPKSCL